jgi:predicted adenylyl cyclase CyaB
MSYLNIEIKAHCPDPERVRQFLIGQQAECRGLDRQTDTYFNVPKGRLKLREGRIENNLIFYERSDVSGPKSSHFKLVPVTEPAILKAALTEALGIRITVIKEREIWYIGNVKFHIDEVPGLGSFVEIEAGNLLSDLPSETLQEQCRQYRESLGIREEDLVAVSYSDLLIGE